MHDTYLWKVINHRQTEWLLNCQYDDDDDDDDDDDEDDSDYDSGSDWECYYNGCCYA